MRIVREQMLCIVSPGWTGDPELLANGAGLRTLCRALGFVHFASLALLPALPGALDEAPSLLLELAVDEGLRPHDALTRLAFHPSAVLWSVYQPFWPEVSPPSVGARSEALLQHLLAHLSVAEGAFVGPRDLPVQRIAEERKLWSAVRDHAPTLSAQEQASTESLALTLARWLFCQERFSWALQTSPRSFFRGRAETFAGWLKWFVGVLATGWAVAWLIAWVVQLAGAAVWKVAGEIGFSLPTFHVPGYVWDLGLRLGLVLAAFGVVLLALIVVPGWLWPAWRGWFRHLDRELNRPTTALSSDAAYLFGCLLGAAFCAGVAVLVAFVVLGRPAMVWLQAQPGRWPAAVRAAAEVGAWSYLLLLAGLFLLLLAGLRTRADSEPVEQGKKLRSGLLRLKQWFHRPRDETVERAQQVHRSVEACEARLVSGTAHMISLTELRRPYAWSAWWTRRVLRVVTFFGYTLFTHGRLGSIPGIQYAHWHLVQGGRRLLFCANFDGTFGGYLDDFIKGASEGTTLFWRWTELRRRPAAAPNHPCVTHDRRFPPTRLLVYRGVRCELRFKTYARESMVPHLARFDRFDLSGTQKMRANRFRDALCGERTLVKDDLIVRGLES